MVLGGSFSLSEPQLLRLQDDESLLIKSHFYQEGHQDPVRWRWEKGWVKLNFFVLSVVDGCEVSRPYQLIELLSYWSLPILDPGQARQLPQVSQKFTSDTGDKFTGDSQALIMEESGCHSSPEGRGMTLGLSWWTDAVCPVTWVSVFLSPSFFSFNCKMGLNISLYVASLSWGLSNDCKALNTESG